MNNTFGTLYSLTTFGESHGKVIGGVIDGCPAGIKIDTASISRQLARRRPGQSAIVSKRQEADKVIFLSGLIDNVTTGAPIAFVIENTDVRSADYDNLRDVFRPGHADYTYYVKYRGYNDTNGGGRSSARETATRVVGGEIARQVLACLEPSLVIRAYTKSVGNITMPPLKSLPTESQIEQSPVRCPDASLSRDMERLIVETCKEGDSVGGVVECIVSGCPVGIGEPIYDKLSARLASAMMSINAAKAFEIGMGFEGCRLRGSEVADNWISDPSDRRGICTAANHSGGIQGGMSNGEDIVFRIGFKPTATMMKEIETVNRQGEPVTVRAYGRHDTCIVPRAVPVVEAMAAMTLLDLILIDRARHL